MALNKTELKADIISLLEDMKSRESEPEQAFNDFAEGLSDIIDGYIKSATIIATPAQITGAIMIADPVTGVVVASNNLSSTIS